MFTNEQQYQQWLQMMQNMNPYAQMAQGGFQNANPMWNQMQNGFASSLNQAMAMFKPFAQQWQQGMPGMAEGFDPARIHSFFQRWPFGFSTGHGFGQIQSGLFGLTEKFQRLQQLAFEIYRVSNLSGQSDKDRREQIVNLCKQLCNTLIGEVNSFVGDNMTVQFVNNVRATLDFQRKLLEEQQVHAAMTPYSSDFDGYAETIKLWQEVCESSLGMVDLYQQFTEVFSEKFTDEFITSLDKKDYTISSKEEVMDMFVQSYEQHFIEFLRSDNFSRTYGQLVNSIIAARSDQQKYIDESVELFGLPSKREMDTAHQRIQKNARELRNLKRQVEQTGTSEDKSSGMEQKVSELNQQIQTLQQLLNEQSQKINSLTAENSKTTKDLPGSRSDASVKETAKAATASSKKTAAVKAGTVTKTRSAPEKKETIKVETPQKKVPPTQKVKPASVKPVTASPVMDKE